MKKDIKEKLDKIRKEARKLGYRVGFTSIKAERLRNKRYYAEHKEEQKERCRKWEETHKEYRRKYWKKRDAEIRKQKTKSKKVKKKTK